MQRRLKRRYFGRKLISFVIQQKSLKTEDLPVYTPNNLDSSVCIKFAQVSDILASGGCKMLSGKSLSLIGMAIGLLALIGCKEDPSVYTKDKAAGRAMEKLVRYAEAHHIPVYKFHGPYFEEVLGLDYPTYTVCFKTRVQYYCYDDWAALETSGKFKNKGSISITEEWLRKQKD